MHDQHASGFTCLLSWNVASQDSGADACAGVAGLAAAAVQALRAAWPRQGISDAADAARAGCRILQVRQAPSAETAQQRTSRVGRHDDTALVVCTELHKQWAPDGCRNNLHMTMSQGQ
jgi:hypothetical protein